MFWRAHNRRRIYGRHGQAGGFTSRKVVSRQFESLEHRHLLSGISVAYSSADMKLTIDGTANSDFINLAVSGGRLQVSGNGQAISSSLLLSSIALIQVNGMAGNDLLTVRGINKHIVFDGGPAADQDQLTVVGLTGNNAFSLSSAASSLTVNGFAYDFTNIDRLTVNGQNSKDTLTLADPPTIPVVFNGAGGVDTLQGPNAASTWAVNVANGGILTVNSFNVQFGGVENLTGGSADDTFFMNTGGSIGGVINGGGGSDTLSYANRTKPITIDPRVSSATNVGRFVSIETLTGTSTGDTIIVPNQANTWVISGPNVVSLNGGIALTGMANITGNNQSDTFVFLTGGYVTGTIDGRGGSDVFSFYPDASANSINLGGSSYTNDVGGGSFTNIEAVVGSSTGNTRLIGPNIAATWNILGSNSGVINGLSFSQIGHLIGGSASDTFVFANSAGVTGPIDGGGGADVLDYSRYTTPLTIQLANILNVETLIGGMALDTLVGPNVFNTWNITGTNAGNIAGLSFLSIENLVGGNVDDAFAIVPGGSLTGSIDGGVAAGTFNELNYSTFTTPVTVNLTTHTAIGIGGGIANITDVLGGSGNDTLTGDTGNNLLSGNAGNDTIDGMGGTDILNGGAGDDIVTGGSDRDLLLGGLGTDTLNGGAGEDILFNGTTTFDNNGTMLSGIQSFWLRTDIAFADRVNALRNGTTGVTVPNGSGGTQPLAQLNSTTVTNDTFIDTLTGGDDLDWFFEKTADPGKDVTDFMMATELEN